MISRVRDRVQPLDPAIVAERERVAAEQQKVERLRQNAARHLEEQRKFIAENSTPDGEKRIAAVRAACTASTFAYILSKVKMHTQLDQESGLAHEQEFQAWRDELFRNGEGEQGGLV